jgi:hypothetical protein
MKCSNCGVELYAGEAVKPGGTGWRHPSKCGPELRELVVRRPSRPGEKGPRYGGSVAVHSSGELLAVATGGVLREHGAPPLLCPCMLADMGCSGNPWEPLRQDE